MLDPTEECAMVLGTEVEPLRDACIAWQGGRDGGSSPIRAAARVLTGTKHYFEADFITRLESEAAADKRTMARARVILDELATRPSLTIPQWSEQTGVETLWVGRGIRSAAQDDQIEQALSSGAISMPLWGLSLSREVAISFGDRFLFELVGQFPAIAAWQESDFKHDERELIAGGRYDVIGMSTADGRTLVQLQFAGPVTGR